MSTESRPIVRYEPYLILDENTIPYVIWFEDALHYYGVPTVVFNLWILVQDLNSAANCLSRAGWTIDTQPCLRIGDAEVEISHESLLHPNSGGKFSLTSNSVLERVPLERFLETDELREKPSGRTFLIESWLDDPSEDPALLIHLAVQFHYLYECDPALKERSFAQRLRYEHRQFHFDVLAGMDPGTSPFRNINYELRECSAPGDKDLFDAWSRIRLPSPVGGEAS
ncbi:uncharacterized protein BDV17DRAFT_298079 [Aspergillus undulatus]|uniref:uncharacterized protein n=1 Tax=Aspergillus undulatus TaxID=1810928 RepID=UPI003CCDD9A5